MTIATPLQDQIAVNCKRVYEDRSTTTRGFTESEGREDQNQDEPGRLAELKQKTFYCIDIGCSVFREEAQYYSTWQQFCHGIEIDEINERIKHQQLKSSGTNPYKFCCQKDNKWNSFKGFVFSCHPKKDRFESNTSTVNALDPEGKEDRRSGCAVRAKRLSTLDSIFFNNKFTNEVRKSGI